MSLKVLIADPDWRFTEQATCFLESHAHLVAHENEPGTLLERAAHWKPDLIILSTELAEGPLLSALEAIEPRPALLLTGWMDRFDRIWRLWQNGGDELLLKPVLKSRELHQAIVTAMENAAVGGRRKRAGDVRIPA